LFRVEAGPEQHIQNNPSYSTVNNMSDHNNNHNNDIEASHDTAFQQWKTAEKAQQEVVAKMQVELLKARLQLERIRGEEDLEKSLATIAEAFPDGIAFPMVKSTFEPTANLTKAKDSLVKNGVITVDEKKRGMTLKPIPPKPASSSSKDVIIEAELVK